MDQGPNRKQLSQMLTRQEVTHQGGLPTVSVSQILQEVCDTRAQQKHDGAYLNLVRETIDIHSECHEEMRSAILKLRQDVESAKTEISGNDTRLKKNLGEIEAIVVEQGADQQKLREDATTTMAQVMGKADQGSVGLGTAEAARVAQSLETSHWTSSSRLSTSPSSPSGPGSKSLRRPSTQASAPPEHHLKRRIPEFGNQNRKCRRPPRS